MRSVKVLMFLLAMVSVFVSGCSSSSCNDSPPLPNTKLVDWDGTSPEISDEITLELPLGAGVTAELLSNDCPDVEILHLDPPIINVIAPYTEGVCDITFNIHGNADGLDISQIATIHLNKVKVIPATTSWNGETKTIDPLSPTFLAVSTNNGVASAVLVSNDCSDLTVQTDSLPLQISLNSVYTEGLCTVKFNITTTRGEDSVTRSAKVYIKKTKVVPAATPWDGETKVISSSTPVLLPLSVATGSISVALVSNSCNDLSVQTGTNPVQISLNDGYTEGACTIKFNVTTTRDGVSVTLPSTVYLNKVKVAPATVLWDGETKVMDDTAPLSLPIDSSNGDVSVAIVSNSCNDIDVQTATNPLLITLSDSYVDGLCTVSFNVTTTKNGVSVTKPAKVYVYKVKIVPAPLAWDGQTNQATPSSPLLLPIPTDGGTITMTVLSNSCNDITVSPDARPVQISLNSDYVAGTCTVKFNVTTTRDGISITKVATVYVKKVKVIPAITAWDGETKAIDPSSTVSLPISLTFGSVSVQVVSNSCNDITVDATANPITATLNSTYVAGMCMVVFNVTTTESGVSVTQPATVYFNKLKVTPATTLWDGETRTITPVAPISLPMVVDGTVAVVTLSNSCTDLNVQPLSPIAITLASSYTGGVCDLSFAITTTKDGLSVVKQAALTVIKVKAQPALVSWDATSLELKPLAPISLTIPQDNGVVGATILNNSCGSNVDINIATNVLQLSLTDSYTSGVCTVEFAVTTTKDGDSVTKNALITVSMTKFQMSADWNGTTKSVLPLDGLFLPVVHNGDSVSITRQSTTCTDLTDEISGNLIKLTLNNGFTNDSCTYDFNVTATKAGYADITDTYSVTVQKEMLTLSDKDGWHNTLATIAPKTPVVYGFITNADSLSVVESSNGCTDITTSISADANPTITQTLGDTFTNGSCSIVYDVTATKAGYQPLVQTFTARFKKEQLSISNLWDYNLYGVPLSIFPNGSTGLDLPFTHNGDNAAVSIVSQTCGTDITPTYSANNINLKLANIFTESPCVYSFKIVVSKVGYNDAEFYPVVNLNRERFGALALWDNTRLPILPINDNINPIKLAVEYFGDSIAITNDTLSCGDITSSISGSEITFALDTSYSAGICANSYTVAVTKGGSTATYTYSINFTKEKLDATANWDETSITYDLLPGKTFELDIAHNGDIVTVDELIGCAGVSFTDYPNDSISSIRLSPTATAGDCTMTFTATVVKAGYTDYTQNMTINVKKLPILLASGVVVLNNLLDQNGDAVPTAISFSSPVAISSVSTTTPGYVATLKSGVLYLAIDPMYAGTRLTSVAIDFSDQYTVVASPSITVDVLTNNIPKSIDNVEQFGNIRYNQGMSFKLTKDIDLTSLGEWIPIDQFSGVLDGDNHTITLPRVRAGANGTGLFAQIQDGKVTNLTINIATEVECLTDGAGVGGLVGVVKGATALIENVNVNGKLNVFSSTKGCYVGGVVGIANNATITKATTSLVLYNRGGNLNMSATGGVVGSAQDSATIDLSSSNKYTEGDDNVGGVVGELIDDATVTRSFALGEIYGMTAVGGIAGLAEYSGLIKSCYTDAKVDGEHNSGGIVGHMVDSDGLRYTYSKGSVYSETLPGGLVGLMSGGIVRDSYSTAAIYGYGYTAGLVGKVESGSIVNSLAKNSLLSGYKQTYFPRITNTASTNVTLTNNFGTTNILVVINGRLTRPYKFTYNLSNSYDGADVSTDDVLKLKFYKERLGWLNFETNWKMSNGNSNTGDPLLIWQM